MRFLIDNNIVGSKSSRVKYIKDTFKLYVLQKEEGKEFMILDSIPLRHTDVLFIIGHNPKVYKYLKSNIENIIENNIVVITCNTKILREFINKEKNIFIPYESSNLLQYYDGREYGFEFNITDCELELYKEKNMNVMEKIQECMMKIC